MYNLAKKGIKIDGFLTYGFFFKSHPDRNYFEPAYFTDLCCDLDIEMSMVYEKIYSRIKI